jgi:hypothetical protein
MFVGSNAVKKMGSFQMTPDEYPAGTALFHTTFKDGPK